jgi:hypothetical protein
MQKLLIGRSIILAAAALLATTGEISASAPHHFYLVNDTDYPMQITYSNGRCDYSSSFPSMIPPHNTATINWEDDNNPWSVPNYCYGKDKFVYFSFHLNGAPEQYDGYLGMTHRNLYSSDWYNGLFYGQDIKIGADRSILGGSDGPPPPAWIVGGEGNENDDMGPWSEIEMAGRDNYNWPRVHISDDEWFFDIRYPVTEDPK